MLDVILFALKIAFLVLLFLFVFFVVRRTVRDVSSDAARPEPAPRKAAPSAPPAAPPAPVVAAVSSVPEATPAERRHRREQRHTERTMPGESLDLMAHIDPRLVVEASPVLATGTEIRLEGWIMIGRSPASDLVLDDPFVSQTHARVVPRGQLHFVEDLGSTNGTFVNGREVIEAQLMLDTELRIGETIFRYEE
ncbi:MAG: FHA domain-containing protein [Thermoleophilia bacterium]